MRPDTLCGLLAEPDRLAVFAAVVLGADVPSEVAARTGLQARVVEAAVRRLRRGGLVGIVQGRLIARTTAFKEAVREHGTDAPPPPDLDPDRVRAAVLRAFVRDGRLVRVPATRSKRRVVLEHIVTHFLPGVRYPERDVDAVLRAWHDDHAALRRYLVDEGLMARGGGEYWRTGGYFDPTAGSA
ncbi:MAG TPA: DUF2087 domain-containing protein [Catenuloplanes sp.]|jgi:hypothetical protein